jgi:hypothetical protein
MPHPFFPAPRPARNCVGRCRRRRGYIAHASTPARRPPARTPGDSDVGRARQPAESAAAAATAAAHRAAAALRRVTPRATGRRLSARPSSTTRWEWWGLRVAACRCVAGGAATARAVSGHRRVLDAPRFAGSLPTAAPLHGRGVLRGSAHLQYLATSLPACSADGALVARAAWRACGGNCRGERLRRAQRVLWARPLRRRHVHVRLL